MPRLPGSVWTDTEALPWGDIVPVVAAHATGGPRNFTTTLAAHFATTSPARRIIAARAWGRTLAQLHYDGRTASPEDTRVTATGPYRFKVTAASEQPLGTDVADDLAAAYAWLRTHLSGRSIDARTALAAFLDGYRAAGGGTTLPLPA